MFRSTVCRRGDEQLWLDLRPSTNPFRTACAEEMWVIELWNGSGSPQLCRWTETLIKQTVIPDRMDRSRGLGSGSREVARAEKKSTLTCARSEASAVSYTLASLKSRSTRAALVGRHLHRVFFWHWSRYFWKHPRNRSLFCPKLLCDSVEIRAAKF
jgi:hypothetical protein